MTMELGPQYAADDPFKKAARLHQSRFRAGLGVGYNAYGNRLLDADADSPRWLNYYDKLGVREALVRRFPNQYKAKRDADLLRSEHIPFNLIAPLDSDRPLAIGILNRAFNLDLVEVTQVEIEYAPEPKSNYLYDGTAFDAYICGRDCAGLTCGIGIEVKYTEHAYPIGSREKESVENPSSPYWTVSRTSGSFINPAAPGLACDDLRQIWRNHLLGLSMLRPRGGPPLIQRFVSITLYPEGNTHFCKVIPAYQSLLTEAGRATFSACTFERFITAISGSADFDAWRAWLERRYLVAGTSD